MNYIYWYFMYIGILCGIVAKLTSEIVLFLCFEKSGFFAPGWCLFYKTTLVVFFFCIMGQFRISMKCKCFKEFNNKLHGCKVFERKILVNFLFIYQLLLYGYFPFWSYQLSSFTFLGKSSPITEACSFISIELGMNFFSICVFIGSASTLFYFV